VLPGAAAAAAGVCSSVSKYPLSQDEVVWPLSGWFIVTWVSCCKQHRDSCVQVRY